MEDEKDKRRAVRRQYANRAKGKAKAVFAQRRWTATPRQIGIQAAMHSTCACRMCTYKDPSTPVKVKGKGFLLRGDYLYQ